MLILKPLCSAKATPRLIEIFRWCSSGSKSVVAVAWSGEPIRAIAPDANSMASAREVLPSCEWPSRTTFLILSGAKSAAIHSPSTFSGDRQLGKFKDWRRLARLGLREGWLGYDLIPMVKKMASIEEVLAAVEAARDKVMADEVKSLTKLGIPKAMAYQMIASRFHQKVGNQEEAEPDPFEGNATSWEEIG